MRAPVPILTPTHSAYERYIPALRALLGRMWPGHAPVWFVTDGNSLKMPRVVRIDSTNWIMRLQKGVQAVAKAEPKAEYLFLLIDDLYPLRPCDARGIAQAQAKAMGHGLNCLCFLSKGETNCSRPVRIGGTRFYRIPRSFWWYSRIQPGIWKISHLLGLCAEALERGFTNCWEFEALKSTGHYAAEVGWPSVHFGLFHFGWVNLEAVEYMDAERCPGFRERMYREYLQQQLSRRVDPRLETGAFQDLAAVFAALSHNARIRILKLLEMRPMSGGQLAAVTGMPLASLGAHLKIMQKAKLVKRIDGLPGAPYGVYPYALPFRYHTVVLEIMRKWENGAPLALRDRARLARIL